MVSPSVVMGFDRNEYVLQPKPTFVVQMRPLVPPEQLVRPRAVGTAEPEVALPSTVFVLIVGKSARVIARKEYAPAPPVEGPARKAFCAMLPVAVKVSAGVEVAVATLVEKRVERLPALKLVTVPAPAGVAHVPSPRQNVELDAAVPLFSKLTGM